MIAGVNERILVIDDEPSVHEVVTAYLEQAGYSVDSATDGREGLRLAATWEPSLIVLDLMLPDVSGEEVCQDVRSRCDTPVLMLSAKSSEDQRIVGLELGADDYLTKPFSPRELVARVKALLRRTHGLDAPLVAQLSFDGGQLTIDSELRQVVAGGRQVELTPSEDKLLLALARHPGRVYSRFELINRVQGYDFEGYERTIDAHVKNLRKKLEPDPAAPQYVTTVHGVGYRLAAPRS